MALVLPGGAVVAQVVVASDEVLPGVVEPGGLTVLGVGVLLASSEVDELSVVVVEPSVDDEPVLVVSAVLVVMSVCTHPIKSDTI